MKIRVLFLLGVAALSVAGLSALSDSAAAAVGAGSFTTITTPSATTVFRFDGTSGVVNQLTVAGQASLDITAVDIVCVYSASDGVRFVTLGSHAPVSGGTFSATVSMSSSPPPNCRLRAIPTGAQTTDYLGSFSGPILYAEGLTPTADGTGTEYDYTATLEMGDSFAQVRSAGACGIQVMATLQAPAMMLGPVETSCMFGLGESNVDPSGHPTKSAVQVDGHNAYLPYGVQTYLIDNLSLPVTQPALTATMSIASNGDVTVTETATLMRCSVSDVYPPTMTSCPNLVSTGVQLQVRLRASRLGHSIWCTENFISSAGAHSLALEYQGFLSAPPTGRTGFSFPDHSTAFAATTPDETVSGFGTKAASMLIRSDMDASADDPSADSFGITWSKAPSVIAFGHTNANVFAMRYALSVPAGGQSSLGFAETESLTTAAVKTLDVGTVTAMINAPTITAPVSGATVPTESTTVRGALTAGSNGVPTSVTVNGHAATITRTSSTAATYSATFTQAWGTHTVTVTARDSAGNTSAKSITVHNMPALVFVSGLRSSGSTLKIPVACKTYAAGTCSGKLIVKNSSGSSAGQISFTVGRGASRTISVTLSHPTHSVKVYLYQREPNGAFPLDASKAVTR